MIHFLDITTTVCVGLLIGVEFAVSGFVNPILWKLEDRAQAEAIRLFAGRLGAAMPPWYILSFLLLICEAIARHHAPSGILLIVAGVIWLAVIVYTLFFLVPINNRMARLDSASFSAEARREHKRWDSLHRVRVMALGVSFVCFLLVVQR